MSITLKEEVYRNYGNCLTIKNERLELKVTLDIGPRIIYASVDGNDNLFFNDIERSSHKFGEEMDSTFGKGSEWFIYGGTRLWFGPEEYPLTYYPDNDKVEYSVVNNVITFIPPCQKVTDMQQKIVITFDELKPIAKVDYLAQNKGTSPRTFAFWALSVLANSGVAIVPQPNEKTGLLANRNIAVWEYTDMSDDRVMWGKDYIALKQIPDADVKPFKFGINNTKGYAAYVCNNSIFIKRFSTNHPDGNYPDYGMSCEVYTNDKILELETLSELYKFNPGDEKCHTEFWEFDSGVKTPSLNQDKIANIVKHYIEK